MNKFIEIGNDRQRLVSTNYFSLKNAKPPHNFIYLSFNAGACRLLVPAGAGVSLAEMKTAKSIEVALETVSGRQSYTIVFEDGSGMPYLLQTTTDSTDRLLKKEDHGQPIQLIVYFGDDSEAGFSEVFSMPCVFNYNL